MEGSINCPYCGEYIKVLAKKCRFCGEWLIDTQSIPREYKNNNFVETPESLEVLSVNENSDKIPVKKPEHTLLDSNQNEYIPSSIATPTQTIQSVGVQPIVVNVTSHQTVEQIIEQNQTTIITKSQEKGARGWFYGEIILIAGIIGIMTKSWLWFFGILIGGGIFISIPFIGHIICIILGLGWGFLARVFCTGLFNSDITGIIIGIFISLGAIGLHFEARKKHVED